MPTTEQININVGPMKLAFSIIGAVAILLAGNLWMIKSVVSGNNLTNNQIILDAVDKRIGAHTAHPHPVTLTRAEEIAKRVVNGEQATREQVSQAINKIEVKQAGFESDIAWIKSSQIGIEKKLDRVLERIK